MRFKTAVVGVLCALAVVLFAGAGAGTAVAAPSPNVVISQLYGGGGNAGATFKNDYVELFNRSSAAVTLSGWSVQYASATGTGNFAATALSGSIAPGGYYLVQLAAGTGTAPANPTPDATGATNMSGTTGKVIVANVATSLACNGGSTPCSAAQLANIVDLVGYGAANFFEGSGPAPATSTNAVADFRKDAGCTDTDDNAADFVTPPPTAAPRNTASPTQSCGGGTPTNPSATGAASPSSVAPGAGSVLTVAVTPGTNPASTGITVNADLTAIGGSATQAFFDDASQGDAVAGDGTYSFQATVDGATTTGSKSLPVSIADAQGRSASTAIALDIAGGCGTANTPIHDVQGNGAMSPITGTTVTIEGVVVGDYQAPGGFGGFYLQEAVADADPATSEGIFVLAGAPAVAPGDVVRVRGNVVEFASGTSRLTELASVSSVTVCATGASVAPTNVTLPVPVLADFERYEGMLVHFSQPLTVTETFTLARFGELRLAQGGRLYTPTTQVSPGAPALALADLNERRSFVLDDGDNRQNIDPTIHPSGGLSAMNTVRSGDTVGALDAVFDDRFSNYRAQPVAPVAISPTNPRTAAPPAVGGNLKVASFNVLNLFNGNGTFLEGAAGGFPTARGANTLTEFNRQLPKEVSALAAMDADVVGLMEIENDATPNSAIEDLVAALNAKMGAGTYAFVDTGVIGTDAIRVALIYKPGNVTPVGPFKLLTTAVDPRFIDTKNRPSLAQTFELTATQRRMTVVVNHLKSKGSDCNDVGDPDLGDGQANCPQTRRKAAEALVDWIAGNPTGAIESTGTLVIGDMNAYTFEDAIRVFTDAGYANLVRDYGGLGAYSYVFDGESGYLDHALATAALAPRITGAVDWHINADEPIALDYNTEFKTAGQVGSFYDPGPYRSSDHDPVIVGVSLTAKADQRITFTSTAPTGAQIGGTYVPAASSDSGLPVTLSIDPASSSVCTLSSTTVSFVGVGTCTINADQAGSIDYNPAARASQSFTVARIATTLTAAPTVKGLFGLLPTRFTATLRRAGGGTPISGQTVTFSVGPGVMCAAPTNSAGIATCTATIGPLNWLLAGSYTATYGGSATYQPSSASGAMRRF